MTATKNRYNQFADRYDRLIKQPAAGEFSAYHDFVVPLLLRAVGDAAGLRVLDAGCGQGHIARILAAQGAAVTAIDIAPRLIELARQADPEGAIDYLVHDLSKPLPQQSSSFDLAVSNLVLNDVHDYGGYIATLAQVLKPGGRLIVMLNNPYSAVIREKVENYFDRDTSIAYYGLAQAGVDVVFYHRTLEDYMAAFLEAGFVLKSLSDLQPDQESLPDRAAVPQKYHHFPYFMLLEWLKDRQENALTNC